MAHLPFQYRQLGQLMSANLNSTVDQAIAINASKYIIDKIIVTNASTTLGSSLAAGGFYSAVSKGGTVIIAATQVYTVLTSSTKFTALTMGLTSDSLTSNPIYLSLTTAHGSAATADIYVYGYIL